jgi:two-component system, LytTR family, sensor histidine kinase AgrC
METMLSFAVEVLSAITSAFVMLIIFERKYTLRTTIFCSAIFSAILYEFQCLPESWILHQFIPYNILLFLILQCFLLKGTPYQKIFALSGILCIMSICGSSSYILARGLWPNEHNAQILAFIIIYLTLLIIATRVILVIARGAKQSMQQDVSGLRWLHYAFGPFNGLLLIRIIYLSIRQDWKIMICNPFCYLFILLQVIWCLSILYHAVVTAQEKARASLELQLIQKGLKADKAYYEKLTAMLNDIRTMRHDLKYHISVMHNLIKQNKVEEAEIYITEIEAAIQKSYVPTFTINQVVNALLLDYHRRCTEKQVAFSTCIDLPGTLISVSNIDLCIILGNLLENAMEATQRLKEDQRRIDLKAFCKGQNLIILATNSFDNVVLVQNGQLNSRKIDAGGIGCQSIRAIACKYQGEYLTQWQSSEFTASVILQLTKEDVEQCTIPFRKASEAAERGIYA